MWAVTIIVRCYVAVVAKNTESRVLWKVVAPCPEVYPMPFPNKGKLYKFEFNSSAAFNLFEGSSEIRVKQWLTSLGYQTLPAFGGEQLDRTIAI